jgi:pimeloyl-ACP methyl ester carboxylesterase
VTKVRANGLMIEVDDRGPRDAPPVLLVMGLGMQLTGWPDEFVDLLLARGFRVIRFDNRDAGLSDGFDHVGVPSIGLAVLRHFVRLPVRSPYALADMAADVVGVLDALQIARAHVVGASLGGMIAQHVAARHPDRVRSLTLMMTTSGSRKLPGPTARARKVLLSRPANGRMETLIAHSIDVFTTIGSPGFRPVPAQLHERVAASLARAFRPAGSARQLLAIAADGDRTPLLARIQAPTQVIHGVDDPLVPAASGHDLLRRIAGAQGDFIEGMGHDLPLPLLDRFAERIAANAGRAPAC